MTLYGLPAWNRCPTWQFRNYGDFLQSATRLIDTKADMSYTRLKRNSHENQTSRSCLEHDYVVC